MGNQRFSITPSKAAADPDLPDTVFRTLAILGTYGDKNGWCWPSLATIAEQRNMTPQAISKHIKVLEERGYLNVHRRQDKKKGNISNKYQIRHDYPLSTSDDDRVSTSEVDVTSQENVPTKNHTLSADAEPPKIKITNDDRKFAEEYFKIKTGLQPKPGNSNKVRSWNATRWYTPLRSFLEMTAVEGRVHRRKYQALIDLCIADLGLDKTYAPQSFDNVAPKVLRDMNGHAPASGPAYRRRNLTEERLEQERKAKERG